MENTILINRIDIRLHYAAINRDFQIVQINADEHSKLSYGQTVNEVYDRLCPLSLAELREGIYVAMQTKGSDFKIASNSLALKIVAPDRLPDIVLARLLIGALPSLQDSSLRPSEGVGLFYLVDIETIAKFEALRTFQIELEMDHSECIALKISGATFTPIKHHTDAHGNLFNNCRGLTRYHYCQESGSLKASKKGNYLKKRHYGKRMRSEMVSLNTKNPSKFWKSKMGVLDTFISDLEKCMNEYISIEFQKLPKEFHYKFKDIEIETFYNRIDHILKKQKFNVVNHTKSDITPLIESLHKDGFAVTESSTPKSDELNIVVHHSKIYYEENGLADPYSAIERNSKTVVQSITPDNILKNNEIVRAVYEACKKEIVIKLEVAEKKLKLVDIEGRWLFAKYKVENKIRSFECMEIDSNILKFSCIDFDSAQSVFLEDLPIIPSKNGQHIIIDLLTNKTFVIEETKLVALPEFKALAQIMRELENGYDLGIRKEWITEFIQRVKEGTIHLKDEKKITDKLASLLSSNYFRSTFYKDDFFKARNLNISYRGGYQVFFDWIHAEKGVRMGASVKSSKKTYIEAGLGLFYSEQENMYFVGDKSNLKSLPKFCRIRRIITDEAKVPSAIFEMMKVFHIRHRQATILPFPFKHLREFFDPNPSAIHEFEP